MQLTASVHGPNAPARMLVRTLALVTLMIMALGIAAGPAAAQGGLSYGDYKKMYEQALSELDACKHNHKVLKQRLDALHEGDDPGGMYGVTKELLKTYEKCILRLAGEVTDLKKKLDELKNMPGVIAPADDDDRGQPKPPKGWDPRKFEAAERDVLDMEKLIEDGMKKLAEATRDFDRVEPPEDR